MLRLPPFTYRAPADLAEAASILAGEGPAAMLVAGGTDLYPKMKRRQMTPTTVVGLRRIDGLVGVSGSPAEGVTIGALTTLTALTRDAMLAEHYPAVVEAARVISTPQLRNAGTIAGNLCVDTRCTYYDQTFQWRKAIDFCLKKDGEVCWVAPGSPKCLAVTSSDLAPVMIALRARLRLVGPAGERTLDVAQLYQNDGINFLTKKPEEVIAAVELPPADGLLSTYLKLRRRPAFDFPVLGAAVALRRNDGHIEDPRVVLGGVGSAPSEVKGAVELLSGAAPSAELYAQAAKKATGPAKSMDNTDLIPRYRKRVAAVFVERALRALAPPPDEPSAS